MIANPRGHFAGLYHANEKYTQQAYALVTRDPAGVEAVEGVDDGGPWRYTLVDAKGDDELETLADAKEAAEAAAEEARAAKAQMARRYRTGAERPS